MKDLPRFKPRPREEVRAFIADMLTNHYQSPQSHLRELVEYPDGHYRALFSPAYFALPEGQSQPSKSQWNNLKKKLKRHDPRLFIFKEHGETDCGGQPCCYIDFGFFAR